jgi:hypothetical protein
MANTDYAGVNHDLRCVNGRYIQMPVWISGESSAEIWGNLDIPNPHANSSVGDTTQKYPIGTKFVDGDRTFFYGYMHTVYTATKANIGVFNMNEANDCTFSATAGVAGDTIVGVVASTLDVSTTPSVDDYAGGWFMPRTNPYSSYRVLHSTTATGGRTSGDVDLTIDFGLIEAVEASQGNCFLNMSEYSKLQQDWAGGAMGAIATCPGVTLIDPIASTYQWVQAWGPCYVVPYNDEIGAAGNRDAFFHIDGSIKVETRASGAMSQRAGYMLNCASTSNTATWLIKLQIDK